MNKQEFLSALEAALTSLPRQDRQKTLDFYKEMIDDRQEEGLTEEEIVASIGTPAEIAAQVLSELPPKPRKKVSWVVIFLLILGSPVWLPLSAAAAIILLSVIVVLFSIELTFALCGVAFVLGAVFLLLLWKPLSAVFCLGIGLVCLGLAIPFFFLCMLTAKAIWRLVKKPFQRKERIQ